MDADADPQYDVLYADPQYDVLYADSHNWDEWSDFNARHCHFIATMLLITMMLVDFLTHCTYVYTLPID